MKYQTLGTSFEQEVVPGELDLVVPFTTPELTRSAIQGAERLAPGLHAAIRLIKLQTVPYATEMSPVHLGFLKEQLESFHSTLPVRPCLLLTRDGERDLERALGPESIVVLASKRRPWRTRTEWTAARLRKTGHRVLLIYPKERQNA